MAKSNEVTRADRRHGVFMVGVIELEVFESRGLMFALFQWVLSRTFAMVSLVVPSSFTMVASDTCGKLRSSQAIASGRSLRLETGV